jgi:hypothetical protein
VFEWVIDHLRSQKVLGKEVWTNAIIELSLNLEYKIKTFYGQKFKGYPDYVLLFCCNNFKEKLKHVVTRW